MAGTQKLFVDTALLQPSAALLQQSAGLSQESTVTTARIAGSADIAPAVLQISSVLGTSADVARNVAIESGALSEAPQFSYPTVQYGTAAYATPGATLSQYASDGVNALRALMLTSPISLAGSSILPAFPTTAADEAGAYNCIVEATRGLLGDISLVENQSIAIERVYLQLSTLIQSLQTRIAQLTDTVATTRDTLRSAQSAAAQTAGNYAAAQQLVQEEIARVAAADASRSAAFAAATGLFYARELQSTIAVDLPPSLALTADTLADLVPGCAADHAGPPASLQPFLDQLLEVPLANWSALAGAWTDLPDNIGLQRVAGLRTARLANWAPSGNFGSGAAASDLAALATTGFSVFDPVFRASVTLGPSLALNQQAAFAVFSPPDIMTLPPSNLRTNAEALRGRLESAAGCLVETLTSLPPDTRFNLANLARAGTLPPLAFAQWPIPASLGSTTATTVRRLAALVDWMAAQLTDGASAASQTALGNLVAASVVAVAYGDPNDAVTGTVASTGFVPRLGVPIRVILNRTPPIGTVMNLLDDTQSVVGTLRVEDNDALGTTTTVVSSTATLAPTSKWSVSVPGSRAPWLSS